MLFVDFSHREKYFSRVVKQQEMFKKQKLDYGGDLQKKRSGRQGARPLDTRNTMHVVLKSSRAKGAWSLRRHRNRIKKITEKFALKNGIKIVSHANVGNHLHFHLKLTTRFGYKPFIRAITGAIAQLVTKASRTNVIGGKFWDYRPFTRIVQSYKAYLLMEDYIWINQFEGLGFPRAMVKEMMRSLRERGFRRVS